MRFDLDRLREIGWSLWDPIGLKSKLDEGYDIEDEYDAYLMRAAGMVANGVDEGQVAKYLVWVETDGMGLSYVGDERAAATALAIKAYVTSLGGP